MRVADMSEFFSDFGGGVRTYVHQKLEAAAKAGVTMTIIAPGPADRRERRLGGEIVWVRSPVLPFDHRYHLFARKKPVHALLDELQPDFVEGSSTWRGAWIARSWSGKARRALFLHQDPVAVYPQSFLSPALKTERVDQMFAGFWRYMANLSAGFDATIAPSAVFARRLDRHGVARALACPLGVDRALFGPDRRRDTLRLEMLADCGVKDPAAPLFIAVSRHHPEKRLPMMMRAFAKFSAARPAALYLIGDGPMWRSVGSQARRIRGVAVAGPVTDRELIAAKLASADYFVHAGAAETFGLVVAEALASGVPIIAPDQGGASEFAHPAYAESYRAGEAEALAAAMARIVGRDRRELAIAARAGAHRVSTPAEHFDKLFSAYGALCEAAPAREAA
ncbi:MAG: glycosyltransferase [Parvularculaceae bacterium]|nr:glycosyltransferase [Parvularculaceae bacterium]